MIQSYVCVMTEPNASKPTAGFDGARIENLRGRRGMRNDVLVAPDDAVAAPHGQRRRLELHAFDHDRVLAGLGGARRPAGAEAGRRDDGAS